jgi:hypothetical protein
MAFRLLLVAAFTCSMMLSAAAMAQSDSPTNDPVFPVSAPDGPAADAAELAAAQALTPSAASIEPQVQADLDSLRQADSQVSPAQQPGTAPAGEAATPVPAGQVPGESVAPPTTDTPAAPAGGSSSEGASPATAPDTSTGVAPGEDAPAAADVPVATETPPPATPTPTATPLPSATPVATATSVPTEVATSQPTPVIDEALTVTPTPTATPAPSSSGSSSNPAPIIATARAAPTIAPIPSVIGGSHHTPYMGNPDADEPIRVTYPWMATPGTPITLADPRLGTTGAPSWVPPASGGTASVPAPGSSGSFTARPGGGTFGNPGPAPTPGGGPVAGNPDGSWNGMTSQGRPISFTVSGDSITSISVGYSITGCVSQEGTTSIQFNQPNAGAPSIAEDNTFFVVTPPSTGMGIGFVQGTFNSATSATGTLKMTLISLGAVDASGAPCSPGAQATWTANKS